METALMVVMGLIAVVDALVLIVTAHILWEAFYYQALLGPGLERDLGFRQGAAYMNYKNSRGFVSAVAIVSVNDGGVFQQAGFRRGDVLPDVSHSSLFKSLHRRRGQTAELAVVDGGPGPAFHERTRRVIAFTVPSSRHRRGARG